MCAGLDSISLMELAQHASAHVMPALIKQFVLHVEVEHFSIRTQVLMLRQGVGVYVLTASTETLLPISAFRVQLVVKLALCSPQPALHVQIFIIYQELHALNHAQQALSKTV